MVDRALLEQKKTPCSTCLNRVPSSIGSNSSDATDQFWADGPNREVGSRGLLEALGHYLA